jgi:TIR domain/Sel1 repeat
MEDIAHDASGPASPKPGDIAAQQASRPDSPDRGKLRVFISYSRDDLHFADQLNAALDLCGFECVIDRHGISGGEDWKRRLGTLISEADTVVFVLSPTSARSEICAWEVEEPTRLGKRILPVNCRPLGGASPPPRLRDLNYIFFYEDPKESDSGFGTGLASLVAALNTDFDWLREHTRYLQRATEWDRGGRPANRLLSGNDIAEAKAWAARRPKSAPEPTALHLDFIRASEEEAEARSSAQRQQLEAMAAAQAERETALHKAEEAQKKAEVAQRKRARIRNIALVVVSVLALLAVFNGWHVVQQARQADDILASTTEIIAEIQHQMSDNTKKRAFAVFQRGADHGDTSSMRNLGILYENGQGVPQDYAKAREWYEKAVDKGNVAAMNNLAFLWPP